MEIKPPKPNIEDIGKSLSKGVVGAIPFFGGLAGEVLENIWNTRSEKRLIKWRENISIALESKLDKSEIEALVDNEEFNSLLTEATIIALRNHQETKLNAIKNLLVNSTKSPEEYDFNKLFLNYIDQFTAYHLRILGSIQNNLLVEKSDFLSMNNHKQKLLTEIFHGDGELMDQIVAELLSGKGLISDTKGAFKGFNTTQYLNLTNMGKRFITMTTD